MTVLVVYASRHGATRQIAERIAATLTTSGQSADVRAVEDRGDLSGYDAFVIGAAAYYGHWLKSATEFAQAHQSLLGKRPVWLFSSGPLGTETIDEHGHNPSERAVPQELNDLQEAIRARGHHVFFGALDPDGLTLPERTLRRLPAGRALLPEGDFRNWEDIDAWASEIAGELSRSRPTLNGQRMGPSDVTDRAMTSQAPGCLTAMARRGWSPGSTPSMSGGSIR